MSNIKIIGYTDGGFSSIHSVGSWAYVLYDENNTVYMERKGIVNHHRQTSQVAEITAIFEVFKALYNQVSCGKINISMKIDLEIYSDSQYCVNTINQWMYTWASKGWNVDKQNLDLWKQIYILKSKFRSVKMNWVKGHNGDPLNEKVDQLNQLALKEHIKAIT